MPFAPVVLEEKAADVFDVNSVNAYACRFMTIACNVRPVWRKRIAAAVHVGGSARPQTIAPDANPLSCDVVSAFERRLVIGIQASLLEHHARWLRKRPAPRTSNTAMVQGLSRRRVKPRRRTQVRNSGGVN
jgi:hypothetical protein